MNTWFDTHYKIYLFWAFQYLGWIMIIKYYIIMFLLFLSSPYCENSISRCFWCFQFKSVREMSFLSSQVCHIGDAFYSTLSVVSCFSSQIRTYIFKGKEGFFMVRLGFIEWILIFQIILICNFWEDKKGKYN